jgi:hypothetical protein
MRARNILVGRDGSAVSGDLLDPSITIATALGKLPLKTDLIAWIHFKGTPGTPSDEVWLHNGDRLTGKIAGKQVRWRDATTGKILTIPYARVHTIVLSRGVD